MPIELTTQEDLNAPIELPRTQQDDIDLGNKPQAPEANPDATDIMDFDFDEFGGSMSSNPNELLQEEQQVAATPPAAEPAAQEVPAAVPSEPAGEADEKPSSLREQVIAANERAKEAQAKLAEIEAEAQRLREERDNTRTRLDRQTEVITRAEAITHPEITAISEPWDNELESMAQEMDSTPGSDGNKLRRMAHVLVSDRAALGDPSSEGFDERRAAFVSQIEENFPEEDRREISKLITRGARVTAEVQKKVDQMTANAEEFQYEQQKRQFQDTVAQYDEIEKGFGAIPVGVAESDPNDPRVVLGSLIETIPQLKERGTQLKQYLRRVHLPLAPIDPQSMVGMSQEEQVNHMQERMRRYDSERLALVQQSWESGMWKAVGPLLHKLLADTQGRAAATAQSTPKPRDNAADQSGHISGEETLSPADFKINPNPSEV